MKPLLRLLLAIVIAAALLWLFFTALLIAIAVALVMSIIGAILTAIGLRPRPPADDPPSDPLGIGVDMAVNDYIEDGCHTVEWNLMDERSEDLVRAVDPFIASAIREAVKVYGNEKVEWLILEHQPEEGRLVVFPADEPDPEAGEERFHSMLNSLYLQTAYMSTSFSGNAYDELYRRVWKLVSESLRNGHASEALAEARKNHPMRIASYDYFSGADRDGPKLTPNGELIA